MAPYKRTGLLTLR